MRGLEVEIPAARESLIELRPKGNLVGLPSWCSRYSTYWRVSTAQQTHETGHCQALRRADEARLRSQ
jgi:hypothetical protein